MLNNSIALFKARNDLNLAKSLASEMIIDGTIERIGLPVTVAKVWMGLALLGLCLLTALFLWIGTASHWGFAIPSLLFGGLIYAIVRIWRGVNRGVEAISKIAKEELKRRVQNMGHPSEQPAREKPLEN